MDVGFLRSWLYFTVLLAPLYQDSAGQYCGLPLDHGAFYEGDPATVPFWEDESYLVFPYNGQFKVIPSSELSNRSINITDYHTNLVPELNNTYWIGRIDEDPDAYKLNIYHATTRPTYNTPISTAGLYILIYNFYEVEINECTEEGKVVVVRGPTKCYCSPIKPTLIQDPSMPTANISCSIVFADRADMFPLIYPQFQWFQDNQSVSTSIPRPKPLPEVGTFESTSTIQVTMDGGSVFECRVAFVIYWEDPYYVPRELRWNIRGPRSTCSMNECETTSTPTEQPNTASMEQSWISSDQPITTVTDHDQTNPDHLLTTLIKSLITTNEISTNSSPTVTTPTTITTTTASNSSTSRTSQSSSSGTTIGCHDTISPKPFHINENGDCVTPEIEQGQMHLYWKRTLTLVQVYQKTVISSLCINNTLINRQTVVNFIIVKVESGQRFLLSFNRYKNNNNNQCSVSLFQLYCVSDEWQLISSVGLISDEKKQLDLQHFMTHLKQTARDDDDCTGSFLQDGSILLPEKQR